MKLITIGLRNVVIERRVELRVGGFADAGSATAKVQHGGRGDADLGRVARSHTVLEKLKVSQLDILGVSDCVDHTDDGRRQLFSAIGLLDGDRNIGFDAAELLQKINVEIGSSEFAIGDALQAHVFLKLDDLTNGLVFHRAQLLGRDLAFGFLCTRLQQVLGAKKAAHMVVAGGQGGQGHGATPTNFAQC